MSLARRVQAFASRHQLWSTSTRVVAAVSGGSDSVALAHLLHELAGAGRFRLVGLAHLHHGIRGAAADADAAFVDDLARNLGVAMHGGRADVPSLAARAGQSLEMAGRQARLSFYAEAIAGLNADVIALAHTRSDQAETVVLRLARGTGTRGLGAMAPRSGHRIRPLLDVGRGEMQRWLRARGLGWCEDASNADLAIARNRVRHAVLPHLAVINVRAEEAMARAARIAAADAALLDDLATAEASRLVQRDGPAVVLDVSGVAALPEALARRVVLAALRAVDPHRFHGWHDTDAVMAAGTDGVHERGAIRMERIGPRVVLTNRGGGRARPPAPLSSLPLQVPGRVDHPSGWWTVDAAGPLSARLAPPPTATCAVLDADALGRHLTVRGWRPGDRVQPLGMRGRKKLQDLFVDRKVPRDDRGRVPVVCDAEDRVAWVGGLVVGEAFRVTPHTSGVVVLTLRW